MNKNHIELPQLLELLGYEDVDDKYGEHKDISFRELIEMMKEQGTLSQNDDGDYFIDSDIY